MDLTVMILKTRALVGPVFRAAAAIYAAVALFNAFGQPVQLGALLFDLSIGYVLYYAGGLALELDRAERQIRVLCGLESALRLPPIR